MATYRAYLLNDQGHIHHPPHVFDSVDDEAAITHAKQCVDGCDVEVWDHDRIIALIGADGVKPKSSGTEQSSDGA